MVFRKIEYPRYSKSVAINQSVKAETSRSPVRLFSCKCVSLIFRYVASGSSGGISCQGKTASKNESEKNSVNPRAANHTTDKIIEIVRYV